MNPAYLEQLKYWGIREAVMIATAVALALIQRYIGATIEPPPPPPVQVTVQPVAGDQGNPKVAVHYPQPQKRPTGNRP